MDSFMESDNSPFLPLGHPVHTCFTRSVSQFERRYFLAPSPFSIRFDGNSWRGQKFPAASPTSSFARSLEC